uniref:Protein FAR1-RELATED SEQUENCE n=1 Tax=Setaria italica TaxID=4555 RepID=K3XQJ5_SETIT
MMSELFGGRQNWPFTEKDLKNMVWEYELNQLYTQHKDKNLKERLESLINYLLGPTQFEVEWKKLVDECGIVDNPAIIALWEKRKSWIATYFEGMYCGKMTSTQRSESQNRVLKDGYVNNNTTLHMFAKRVLHSLQHTDHMDAEKFVQAEVIRACKSRFDEQLSKVYKTVYQEYKKQYGNSTTFVIEPNPDLEVRNGYLVTHEKGMRSFCWARYAFRVVEDKEAGVYECKCKQWEHTGKLVQSIPGKYILKRYTRDARSMIP